MKFKAWLAETHGTVFELVRHFLRRFFDSDLVTEPGQWTKVLVSAFALIAPAFFLMAQVLAQKYRYFSRFAGPNPYRHAVRADQLWLITLGMSIVGLLTAVQWHSLFPGKRDYMALGTLPIRPGQIFLSKFLALLLLASAAILTVNALPSLLFPVVSISRWQVNPSLLKNVEAHAVSCVLASYFFFFAILAIQGVLLNLFRAGWFERITSYLQGVAITVTLVMIVFSFSIGPSVEPSLLRPDVAKWLPPLWFLGLYQTMLGDPNPGFRLLANRALMGLGVAVLVALVSYLISYRRHRQLAVEGISTSGKESKFLGWVVDRLIPNPRQQGATAFMLKTLARSSQHRIVLMGYFGFSVAVALSGIAGMSALVKPDRILLSCFAYVHMVFLLLLLIGLRHVFGIPTELRANWTFQITEREGRGEWLKAVDRLALVPALLMIVLVPIPIEIALVGWRGAGEAVLFVAAYLLLFESLFYEWQKLPFTCSYLPGKVNAFILVLRFLGALTVLPIVNVIVVACLYSPIGYAFVLAVLLVIWNAIRHSRKLDWGNERLRYEEEPEPAVRSLRLGFN